MVRSMICRVASMVKSPGLLMLTRRWKKEKRYHSGHDTQLIATQGLYKVTRHHALTMKRY